MNKYPDGWSTLSRDTKRSRLKNDRVQCSCCGGRFAWDEVEVHHTSYRGDRDRAGVNLFPVCGSTQDEGSCHYWLHFGGSWNRFDDDIQNHNDAHIVRRLQRGYVTGNPDGIPWFNVGVAMVVAAFAVAAAVAMMKPKAPAAVFAPSYRGVNVRSDSGTIVGELPNGTEVDVQLCEAGYCKIKQGWVAKRFLVND